MAESASGVAATSVSAAASASQPKDEIIVSKESLKEVFETTCYCNICQRPPTDAALCPHCSRVFCITCYRNRRKCPYCLEKVTKKGLVRCLWVGELVTEVQGVLAGDWKTCEEVKSRPEVASVLEKIADNLRCPVCYDTIADANLCPFCSKMFCGRCLKVWVITRNQSCPCCVKGMTENDLIPCHWGETLGRLVDRLLGKPARVVSENEGNFLPVNGTPGGGNSSGDGSNAGLSFLLSPSSPSGSGLGDLGFRFTSSGHVRLLLGDVDMSDESSDSSEDMDYPDEHDDGEGHSDDEHEPSSSSSHSGSSDDGDHELSDDSDSVAMPPTDSDSDDEAADDDVHVSLDDVFQTDIPMSSDSDSGGISHHDSGSDDENVHSVGFPSSDGSISTIDVSDSAHSSDDDDDVDIASSDDDV